MRMPAASLVLIALSGCGLQVPGPEGPEAGAQQSTRTRILDAAPDVVWFEMQQVLQAMSIPITDAQPGMQEASFASDPFSISPADIRCAVRPSGESPLARSAVAQLRVELERWGMDRTEITFRMDVLGTAVEPDLTAGTEACRSRGTLEERILELTARGLRRA